MKINFGQKVKVVFPKNFLRPLNLLKISKRAFDDFQKELFVRRSSGRFHNCFLN